MKTPEHYDNDILFFFDGRPAELSLYGELLRHMQAAFPEASVKVQRTQISFYGRRLFAMVSLPRRRSEAGIVLSFGLGRELSSPRVSLAVEPYPGRWTHHVAIDIPEQLDRELLDWLTEAYAFSEIKSRRMPR